MPDRLWARGPAGAEDDPAARILPCRARFVERSPGFLTPLGATLPAARTPRRPVPRRALADFLAVERPAPWLAAEFLHPVTLPPPARDDSPREPGALRPPPGRAGRLGGDHPRPGWTACGSPPPPPARPLSRARPFPPLAGETSWGSTDRPARGWAPPAAARADSIAAPSACARATGRCSPRTGASR